METLALFGAFVGVLVIPVGAYLWSRRRYYRRHFAEKSFQQFYEGVRKAAGAAQISEGSDAPPSLEDGTAFVTEGGLAVGVSRTRKEDGSLLLHVSMSQTGQATTHALCSRYSFFLIAMLRGTKGDLTPFYTNSGVHHLVLAIPAPGSIRFDAFEPSYVHYRTSYQPVPFRHASMSG